MTGKPAPTQALPPIGTLDRRLALAKPRLAQLCATETNLTRLAQRLKLQIPQLRRLADELGLRLPEASA